MQESAEVVVLTLEDQSRQEGPNDEVQGRAIAHLVARGPLGVSTAAKSRVPTRRDHRSIVPTGTYRSGGERDTSLESVPGVSEGGGGRCIQPRNRRIDATLSPDFQSSSNRRMRTRMYGGVGAGRGNPPGYPITPGMGVILSGESPVYETGSLKEVSIPNDRSD